MVAGWVGYVVSSCMHCDGVRVVDLAMLLFWDGVGFWIWQFLEVFGTLGGVVAVCLDGVDGGSGRYLLRPGGAVMWVC